MLKSPELPRGFQGRVFKDRVEGGGRAMRDQHSDILLIGWW